VTQCIVCDKWTWEGGWCPVADSRKHGEFLGSSARLSTCQEGSVSWSHCSVQYSSSGTCRAADVRLQFQAPKTFAVRSHIPQSKQQHGFKFRSQSICLTVVSTRTALKFKLLTSHVT